jgi:stalled ribosome rescue protein Dom34
MKQIGIWIDKREAKIITLECKDERLTVVESNIEDYNPKGGSGTKFKGGPQDVVQDSKYFEREHHQMANYFAKIADEIDTAEEIVILGPAQAGSKLNDEFAKKYPKIKAKVKAVEKVDNMTDNQLKAWVKTFYNL